jgi:PH (Pleckstrin Homology) domain-containing protein
LKADKSYALLTEDAAATPMPQRAGLAALFTGHILRDGELILLVLKPSLWFVPIHAAFFSAVVGCLAVGAALAGGVGPRDRIYFDAAIILIGARLMWASLAWMGRLYVLTDQRILRLSGVFTIDLFDCPLRKVAQIKRSATVRERMLGLGSIEIYPGDEKRLPGSWQTVARPAEVQAEIVAAINRAKQ